MKSKLFTLLVLGIFGLTIQVTAQEKVTTTMNEFLKSEFMIRYNEMRVEAESIARRFKNQESNYSEQDRQRVEIAYNAVAQRFNFVLSGIKEDLLDRKKLKYIINYPEDYQKELELDMYKLSDFYAQNFQMVIADVTNNDVDGSAILVLINGVITSSAGIFQLVRGIINYSAQRKKIKRQFSEKELQAKLIDPHKFPMWHELGKKENEYQEGGYDSGGGYQDDMNTYGNEQDYIQFNAQPMTEQDLLNIEQQKLNLEENKIRLEREKKELENQENFNFSEFDEPFDEPFDDPLNGTDDDDGFDSDIEQNGLNVPIPENGKNVQKSENQLNKKAKDLDGASNKNGKVTIPVPSKTDTTQKTNTAKKTKTKNN